MKAHRVRGVHGGESEDDVIATRVHAHGVPLEGTRDLEHLAQEEAAAAPHVEELIPEASHGQHVVEAHAEQGHVRQLGTVQPAAGRAKGNTPVGIQQKDVRRFSE